MDKRKLILIAGSLLLLVGAYAFIEYKIADKFGRFVTIMGNIAENLSKDPHAHYAEFELTDEELHEINITKIANEMVSSLDKNKEPAIAPTAIAADEIRDEEKPTHNKASSKVTKLVKLEDLPAKFRPLKKHLHQPFKMGACQICHNGDPNKPAALVKKNIKDICYECHKTKYTKKFDHKPVKQGRCMDCHDPHMSDTPRMLKAPSTDALCLKCHDEKRNAKGVDKRISMDGAFKHKPAEESCVKCHDPHTADYKSLLKNEGSMKLCLDCHSDLKDHKDMKAWINSVKYKHGAVNDSKNKCLECHDPHSSKHKNILKKDQVSMCLSCHDKEVKSGEDGGMLLNIEAHLKANPKWHGPIKDVEKEGGCAACHDPHGSDNFSILRKSFTKNFYDKFDNKDFFCFKCHTDKKISQEFIAPNEGKITKFRDGKVNLHHLHVNDRKGRSCRACHDEHASKYNHLIRDYTDFNGVMFPLRYIETPTGGSCAPACHKKFEYDRELPFGVGLKVDYAK